MALSELAEGEGVEIEPSAAASVVGMMAVQELGGELGGELGARLARATQVAWATGGAMVPPGEMAMYRERGHLK